VEEKVDFCIKVGKWRVVSQDSLNLFLGFHQSEKLAIEAIKEYELQRTFLYSIELNGKKVTIKNPLTICNF
jgi:hypothetical protein